MYVEEIMALLRYSEGQDPVVAKLARAVLALVENLREAELRAGLAEATLEAERARVRESEDAA